MSTGEVFNYDKLTIEVTESGPSVRVLWRGMSDVREPGEKLVPFLSKLADRLRSRKVTVDFRKFEYMNSATVSPIIQFIKQLDSNGANTVLVYDQLVDWQRVNFLCMKTIARTLSHVEVQSDAT